MYLFLSKIIARNTMHAIYFMGLLLINLECQNNDCFLYDLRSHLCETMNGANSSVYSGKIVGNYVFSMFRRHWELQNN